jgi:hypothetical protein
MILGGNKNNLQDSYVRVTLDNQSSLGENNED